MTMRLLAVYLASVPGRPFRFGRDDCLIFVADWARLVTGRDLAAPWRGLSWDEAAYKSRMRAEGGFAALYRKACRQAGFVLRKGAPLTGDIGLVCPGRRGSTSGAIRLAHGWAVRTRDGFASFDDDPEGPMAGRLVMAVC